MLRIITGLAFLALGLGPLAGQAQGRALTIVAAENFYGDVAQQIAAPDTVVTSILSNPDEDPHLFEASPSVARAIAGAGIVVMNGADYDPWMNKLLRAAPRPGRQVVDVAALLGVKPGANPHLWYDPRTMPAFARALAGDLSVLDPAHQARYQQRLANFIASLDPLGSKVGAMAKSFAGVPVAATEPVFGCMAAALGLSMLDQRFQLAVMNDTEPGARDVAAFERDLRDRRVRVLLYNSQASDNVVRRLLRIAGRSHVPVVGVTETEPAGKTYQRWMLDQLDALDAALSKPAS